MLCRIFLKLAGMSVTAGVLVLAILAVRALTRRRMPKWAHCLLWGLVAACLLCPVLPESGLSLRPQSGELVHQVLVQPHGQQAFYMQFFHFVVNS